MTNLPLTACGLRSALVLTTVLLLAPCVKAAGSQAVVSDVDGVVILETDVIFSGFFTHEEGPTADHPWYAIDVTAGELLDIRLFTNFPSTYWLYQVLDGHAEPGDTPFGPTPDLAFLRQPDFADSTFPRIFGYEVQASGQLLVQIDATHGHSGRFGLQINRQGQIPESASVGIVLTAITIVFGVTRRPRIR